MAKVKAAFEFDADLYARFKEVARERGHKMTWYLEGCMRQIVEGRRRKEVKRSKPSTSSVEKK